MKRLPDWHARLQTEFEAARSRPFAWGEHDCCCFAARCVDAMTGGSLHERVRAEFDAYASAAEAARYLRDGGGLRDTVARFLKQQPVPWGQAAPGDVVLIRDGDEQETLGVCEGPQVLVATIVGVTPLPIERALCAWRVG